MKIKFLIVLVIVIFIIFISLYFYQKEINKTDINILIDSYKDKYYWKYSGELMGYNVYYGTNYVQLPAQTTFCYDNYNFVKGYSSPSGFGIYFVKNKKTYMMEDIMNNNLIPSKDLYEFFPGIQHGKCDDIENITNHIIEKYNPVLKYGRVSLLYETSVKNYNLYMLGSEISEDDYKYNTGPYIKCYDSYSFVTRVTHPISKFGIFVVRDKEVYTLEEFLDTRIIPVEEVYNVLRKELFQNGRC